LQKEVEWGEFRIGDLFEISPTKSYGLTNWDLFSTEGKTPVVSNSSRNNGIANFVSLSPTENGNMVTFSDTTTDEAIFYQPNPFVGYSHVQGMYPINYFDFWNSQTYLFFVASFRRAVKGLYNYGTKFNRQNARNTIIKLPIHKKSEPNWDYMTAYIRKLELERLAEIKREAKARLAAMGHTADIDNHELTPEDQAALSHQPEWGKFQIGKLFDKIEQGARLKKDDHKTGNLPFVMSGVTNTGIVSYINNEEAKKFPKNSITIDIFGNAFYRSYNFAAGDDTGVYWNEFSPLPKEVMLYLCGSINIALKGRFSYGYKLRSSKSHDLLIQLPLSTTHTHTHTHIARFPIYATLHPSNRKNQPYQIA